MHHRRGGSIGLRPSPAIRRAVFRLARLGSLATLLFPATARADESYPTLGVFVGYVFGARPSVEVGLDVRWVELTEGNFGCASSPRQGFGPFAQIAVLGKSRPRLTFGLFAGTELAAAGPSALGELGASLRFDDGANFGLQSGEIIEATWPNVYARQGWFLNEYAVGGGLGFWPTLGLPSECVEAEPIAGRPLRDGSGIAVSVPTCEPEQPELSNEARVWQRDAETECTSIRAFLELAGDLIAAGAPLALVHGALDAAEDEVLHAGICAGIASASSRRLVRPVLAGAPSRPAATLAALRTRLAVESYFDGCVGEGSAAFNARLSAEVEREPELRAARHRIAVDEARHAELGWSIVEWSLAHGGGSVRRALGECLGTRYMGEVPRLVVAEGRRRLRRALEPSAA